MNIRKLMLVVHLWVGLTLGLLAALSGLSGSAMVFGHEIEHWLQPHLWHTPARSGPRATVDEIVANVQRAHPESKLQFMRLPADEHGVYEVWLDGGYRRVNLDQYSGQILASRVATQSVLGVLFYLHTDLLSGERGETLIGIGGMGLFVLSLSGLFVWWPRNGAWKKAFAFRSRAARRPGYELHHFAGWIASLMLLLISITGTALVFDDSAASAVGALFGSAPVPKPKSQPQAGSASLSLDNAVQAAQAALPGAKVMRITPAAKKDAPIVVRLKFPGELHPNGMSNAHLDRYTGRVLRADDARQAPRNMRLMNLRYPLHIGQWGGTLSRVLHFFAGLMPALLYVTGIMMWWHRMRARRRAVLARQLRVNKELSAVPDI